MPTKILRVDDAYHTMLKKLADADRRTLQGFLEITIHRLYDEYMEQDRKSFEAKLDTPVRTFGGDTFSDPDEPILVKGDDYQ